MKLLSKKEDKLNSRIVYELEMEYSGQKTPDRKMVLEIARELDIPIQERVIDLTEVYIADEAFACGTSAYIAPIVEVDARTIGSGIGPITKLIREQYEKLFDGASEESRKYLTFLA